MDYYFITLLFYKFRLFRENEEFKSELIEFTLYLFSFAVHPTFLKSIIIENKETDTAQINFYNEILS